MSRFNVWRDGKVHVKAGRCATCIFRPGNKMRLGPRRVRGMVLTATREDTAIICHDTLGTDRQAVCRGFFNGYRTTPLVMAKLMGLIRFRR